MKANLGTSIGYYTCWMATGAVTAFMLVAFLWGALAYRTDSLRAIDDDWTLLMVPVGIVLGIWAARRTLLARWVHRICLPVGAILCIVGLCQAFTMFASADKIKGTGPMAGLEEYLAGALFLVMAATGVFVMGIAAFGAMLRRSASAAAPKD